MSKSTPTPKLVMGYIEIFANGNITTPDDEAVIHIEGDEDAEIAVHCPDALKLAPLIVRAVNRDHHFDALVKALEGIRDFPYIGEKAAQQMALIAGKSLAALTPVSAQREA